MLWQSMAEQPTTCRLVKRPRANKADRIAHLVDQHERYTRRDGSSPVWIRVKTAGEEGRHVVGKVQSLVRHYRCKQSTRFGRG